MHPCPDVPCIDRRWYAQMLGYNGPNAYVLPDATPPSILVGGLVRSFCCQHSHPFCKAGAAVCRRIALLPDQGWLSPTTSIKKMGESGFSWAEILTVPKSRCQNKTTQQQNKRYREAGGWSFGIMLLEKNRSHKVFEYFHQFSALRCCPFEHFLPQHLNHQSPISIGVTDKGGSFVATLLVTTGWK